MRYTSMILAAAIVLPLVGACSPSAGFRQLGFDFAAAAPKPAISQETAALAQSEAVAAAEGETIKTPALAYAGPVNERRRALDPLIEKYAILYSVPVRLVHHVVRRESTYNPRARNGAYWGLMQISYPTARTMGYRGTPEGLLDAETNLKYAVKYLAGAYLVADGDEARADRFYRTGYYYHAKHKGLLKATGLRS